MLNRFSLKRIRTVMMSWNFFMTVCYAMIFMFSTNYIIANNLSRDFLSSLNYIPTSPEIIFILAIMGLFISSLVMQYLDSKRINM